MGMPHERCDGSNCDKMQNGAYAVEAEFLRYGLEICERCDESHRELLRAALAESLAPVPRGEALRRCYPHGMVTDDNAR